VFQDRSAHDGEEKGRRLVRIPFTVLKTKRESARIKERSFSMVPNPAFAVDKCSCGYEILLVMEF
jgi:hypothetical protein